MERVTINGMRGIMANVDEIIKEGLAGPEAKEGMKWDGMIILLENGATIEIPDHIAQEIRMAKRRGAKIMLEGFQDEELQQMLEGEVGNHVM